MLPEFASQVNQAKPFETIIKESNTINGRCGKVQPSHLRANKRITAEDEFHLLFDSENDGNNEEVKHDNNGKFDDDDGNDSDDSLLEGYKSDTTDFGPMQSSADEHLFRVMSRVLGGQMFDDGIDPMEFRVGMIFRNMKSFAWALQDFYIQECFQGRRVKFKRKMILYRRYASKCPFKVYASLKRHGECFPTKKFS